MAETSMLWTTNGTGHGVGSGYASNRWQAFLRKLFISDQAATACVLNGVDSELAVSGTASPLSVAAGAAISHSFFYENDAAKPLTVTTPVVGLTGGHVILEVNWAAQTVTALAVRNTDGVAAIPTLTQVANTTWQVRLASFTITTGGVIALTDTRKKVKFSNHVYSGGFDSSAVDNVGIQITGGQLALKDQGVSNARLRNSGALSIIGRSANSAGVPADISAVASSGAVLRESGSVLGFGTIATAGIANDAVDDTKVGARVPQFIRRYGGDATQWNIAGNTSRTPTTVRMQAGIATSTGTTVTVPFNVAFSAAPIGICCAVNGGASAYIATVVSTSTSDIVLEARNHLNAVTAGVQIGWFVIGAE